jgi:hypothetical protein
VAELAAVDISAACPAATCSSAGSCASNDSGEKTCIFSSCVNGACRSQTIVAVQGQPCPQSACTSDGQCGGGSKFCTYNKCYDGMCLSTTTTVASNKQCPHDKCTGDSDCGGSSGGPIFDDLGI